jgi:hypothetical protein
MRTTRIAEPLMKQGPQHPAYARSCKQWSTAAYNNQRRPEAPVAYSSQAEIG